MMAGQHSLLVIDDETTVRESIAAYLEDSGFHVFQAVDGEQGLALVDEHNPDLVLCDLKMPKVDGMAVLQAISKRHNRTPVIVISGVGVMSDVVEALRYGATDYLIKPIVDMAVLEHAITRCLEYGRLRKQNRAYRKQLEDTNIDLVNSLAVLEQDQQAGRHIQFKMLPPDHKRFAEFQFSHTVIPSLYLSGDFVDYFTVGTDHVVFFIADVSGHGASSAFVTVLLKNLFARKRSDFNHQNDCSILSPVAMLERANRELLDTSMGKHVTMCVGVLDLVNNGLSFSNAGHMPLPILHSDHKAQYLVSEGMPVGLFEQAEFVENQLELPKSFVLSFFSDGILEVLPVEGVLAQEDHLLSQLQQATTSIDGIKQLFELDQVKDAPDDITILLLSRGMDS